MEKIYSIELSEGCFGPDISINGESLIIQEYNEDNKERIFELRKLLVEELSKNLENINPTDLKTIGEIITTISDDFEFVEEESDESSCDQCGSWNYYNKYINKNE